MSIWCQAVNPSNFHIQPLPAPIVVVLALIAWQQSVHARREVLSTVENDAGTVLIAARYFFARATR
jgi:hypothetical protein